MAGLSLIQRDLPATRQRLSDWFACSFGGPVSVSELTQANPAVGYSSETLLFTVDSGSQSRDYVVRIPPSGGGLFPDYDLEGQTKTQELLHRHGVPTPSPLLYEPDQDWIGSKFLVMPRIVGHIPLDNVNAPDGWPARAGVDVQRRAQQSFLELLADIHRVPSIEAPWLRRTSGIGNAAELNWWHDYARWATDGRVPAQLEEAFAWLRDHRPTTEPEPSISWGDARMANCIFDSEGTIVGALDWELACVCPAEADVGWWLGTRRQTLEAMGASDDEDLPGFDSRDALIARYEALLGRQLVDLEWYEMSAMVRMGCCIARALILLGNLGQTDPMFMQTPLLPTWAQQFMGIGDR